MDKIKLGITCGDINSISLEVILKSLSHEMIFKNIIPVIYGNVKIASYHKNIVNLENLSFNVLAQGEQPRAGRINLVNCWSDNITITLGKATPDGGKYAKMALDKATEDLQRGYVDALVTGPINKQAMKLAGYEYVGHTDYLKANFKVSDCLMMMVSETLKIGLVTDHVPISKVASLITKESVLSKIRIMEASLVKDFGIEKPAIAVLGLNPHAGEEGMLGNEEEEMIGIFVSGPYAADGFFGSGQFSKFHGILAMYHDQGLVGFKTLAYYEGVNFTAGLPIVRTSPDHGTAYDLAGKNEANPESMFKAILAAKDIYFGKYNYNKMRENLLKKRPKLSEELSE
jgi:4-hydroxythreonine-4-phosphate dehydrogenase